MKNFAAFWLTLLLMVGSVNELFAQSDYVIGRFYEGYIILPDGSREDGFIKYDIFNEMQGAIVFATDPKSRRTRTTYKPKTLQGYKVADRTWHSVLFKDIIGPKMQRFLQLESDGFIKLYQYYPNEGNRPDDAQVVIQKGDEVAFNQGSLLTGFHKKVGELVSEHEELAAKVRNKEKGYKLLQLYDIIDEYNTWYQANH